jgi:hypothetical protein
MSKTPLNLNSIEMAINIILFISIESVDVCSENSTTNNKPILSITFGSSNTSEYSRETPDSFNFSTANEQKFEPEIADGKFGFVNKVPDSYPVWHVGALDHTPNDVGGYMFLINVGEKPDTQLFRSIVNNLSIGLRYEFSAYLTNVDKKRDNRAEPNVRFEVRANTSTNRSLAQLITGDIPQYGNLTWFKYSLPFIAANSSVELLMFSHVGGKTGNDLAIDDIELSVYSTAHCVYCCPG